MQEKDVEKYLKEQVAAQLHGKAMKWVSPGNNGVPDRLVIVPGGRIYFVELKAPGEEPRKLQKYIHEQMREMGCVVLTIDTKEKVDSFIKAVSENEI